MDKSPMNNPIVREPIGTAVLVLNDRGHILLGKRQGGYKPGTYGVPGGHVEGKDPLEETARRELAEETALEALGLEFIGTVREWQDTHNFIHFVYVCRAFRGTPTITEPEKCAGWEWYDLDSLPTPLLIGHQAAIDLFVNNKSFNDLENPIH